MKTPEHIAFLVSNKLGDSLLLLPLAHNLMAHGYEVTVFGRHAYALSAWLPGLRVQPIPNDGVAALSNFDRIFQMDLDQPLTLDPDQSELTVDSLTVWLRKQPPKPLLFLEELRQFAQHVYGINSWSNDCHLYTERPDRLRHNSKRIVIHPTAGTPERYWSAEKFVRLAQRLCQKGYEVSFVVEKSDAESWVAASQGQPFDLRYFDSLLALGNFIHESAYVIGNDSGIGHLASALGVPTITICNRPRNLIRWRPQWAPGVIVPHLWLPLRTWRRKYWRFAVTVGAVERSLRKIQRIPARTTTNGPSIEPAVPAAVGD